MANEKFYHVFLMPEAGVDEQTIRERMNLATDWFRYSISMWILYSNASMAQLMTRFRSLAGQNGRLFICELNISNKDGWVDQAFIDWLNKKRD
jgi:hypothetical protein